MKSITGWLVYFLLAGLTLRAGIRNKNGEYQFEIYSVSFW
ncbi:Hypothetical protein EAG7_01889 [Klebsiella aerogenes]|nr:Hypothetical protein EAG7_01889 [Klebsiella aerogenes]PVF73809.1 hypothetical protein CSC18_2934 [Klebsiella aerogenes]CCG30364.1 hypothetical protein [Klebsiella aerogenes EA1509E]